MVVSLFNGNSTQLSMEFPILSRQRNMVIMLRKLPLLLLLLVLRVEAQDKRIKIETKEIPNRLAFYAINENEQDFDVMININGTNFRQSKARPRFIRVPGASKVHLKTIILVRGKTPNYTYDLVVNDSLSNRALKTEFEKIKVKPKKSISVYITDACINCDSIVRPLELSNYIFKALWLRDHPDIKEQLKSSFSRPVDSIVQPIINLGGRLFTNIENYAQLLEALNKQE